MEKKLKRKEGKKKLKKQRKIGVQPKPGELLVEAGRRRWWARNKTQAFWEKRERAAKGRRSSSRTIQMPMIDLGEEEGGEGCEREEVKVARREELKKKAIWERPRCPSSRPCGPRALFGWSLSRPWRNQSG
ncbi:unnamed protein product [Prunus brigantina]